ncbi:MAG: glycosyltransferase [Alphaproteobacteria bacterium]|nr:glycosyltransferase [Alphaproteobacteria bacterium]
MPKHRLLFYTHGLVGGGGERIWAAVASGLSRRGHDVGFAVDFVAQENEHLIAPEVRRFTLGSGHAAAIASLAKLLKAEQPQVAFAAIGASNVKLLAAKALAGWCGAAVMSAHGRFDAESRFLGRATYLATAITSRLAARTVAASDDLRRYLIDRFHADARRIVTIHNGIALPPDDLVPDSRALAARENVILGVGRLVPEKGFDTLIKAIAKSPAVRQLILLGEGPYRPQLEKLIAQLGLSDRVILRGYVRELSPIYTQAKMLALSSRSEAFGNVIVEALGHGLPVVATDCGGPREILAEGRYGRLASIDDVDALAKAIDETLRNPGDPSEHRARAQEFSLDRALDRFEMLIEEVVKAGD